MPLCAVSCLRGPLVANRVVRVGRRVAIFDVPQRFSQKRVHDKVPTMDSTEFHAMFHEAATRGWDEGRAPPQLARLALRTCAGCEGAEHVIGATGSER